MKKVLLIAGILLSILSCNSNKKSSDNSIDASLQPSLMTSLNGISYADASIMINRFLHNKTINYSQATIWFKKSIINSMDSLLHVIKNENVAIDGVRLYFGKDSINRNTVIAVATFSDGYPAPNDTSELIHRDFFYLNAHYLTTPDARGTANYSPVQGALLFNNNFVCPPDSTSTGCDSAGLHYISCTKAQSMISTFLNSITNVKKDTINITSEWFDLGVFDDINNELKKNNKADGLRVYVGRDLTPQGSTKIFRDAFILVTTEDNRTDYYKCFALHPVQVRSWGHHGIDDNGEQCPTNCNVVTWK